MPVECALTDSAARRYALTKRLLVVPGTSSVTGSRCRVSALSSRSLRSMPPTHVASCRTARRLALPQSAIRKPQSPTHCESPTTRCAHVSCQAPMKHQECQLPGVHAVLGLLSRSQAFSVFTCICFHYSTESVDSDEQLCQRPCSVASGTRAPAHFFHDLGQGDLHCQRLRVELACGDEP